MIAQLVGQESEAREAEGFARLARVASSWVRLLPGIGDEAVGLLDVHLVKGGR